MAKNILVITGSPRKNGNSDQLADAFIAGAKQSGHNVLKYATASKNIKGCIDCRTCFSKGAACSVSDDFNELAEMLEQVDMVVFVTPMYWFSFPMHLKAAIDKFISFFIGQRTLKVKECALIVCGGDQEESVYEGVLKSYQLIADFMKWNSIRSIIVKGVYDKGDILKTDGLRLAEEFGRGVI